MNCRQLPNGDVAKMERGRSLLRKEAEGKFGGRNQIKREERMNVKDREMKGVMMAIREEMIMGWCEKKEHNNFPTQLSHLQ